MLSVAVHVWFCLFFQLLIDRFERLHEVYEEELKPTFDHLLKRNLKKFQEQKVGLACVFDVLNAKLIEFSD